MIPSSFDCDEKQLNVTWASAKTYQRKKKTNSEIAFGKRTHLWILLNEFCCREPTSVQGLR